VGQQLPPASCSAPLAWAANLALPFPAAEFLAAHRLPLPTSSWHGWKAEFRSKGTILGNLGCSGAQRGPVGVFHTSRPQVPADGFICLITRASRERRAPQLSSAASQRVLALERRGPGHDEGWRGAGGGSGGQRGAFAACHVRRDGARPCAGSPVAFDPWRSRLRPPPASSPETRCPVDPRPGTP